MKSHNMRLRIGRTILHFRTAYCVILGKETASKVFLYCPRKAPYNHTCQTSFVRSDFQTSNAVWKCRMPFLLPKLWAIWKFWPSGAILSFSLRLQDSMAPSGQNFHTALAFGGRNVTHLQPYFHNFGKHLLKWMSNHIQEATLKLQFLLLVLV